MTIVRSLLMITITCPCCRGLGKIRECILTGEERRIGVLVTCPHCEGSGSVMEKDRL